MKTSRLATLLIIAAPAHAAATEGTPIYVVTRVEPGLADDARVGQINAGMLCLPSDTLRWKDVPIGTREQRRQIVRTALEGAGLQVSSFSLTGAGAKRELRVRAVISNAGFHLCARSARAGLRGEAAIATDWSLESPSGTPPVQFRLATLHHYDTPDAVTRGEVFQQLLREAAGEAAKRFAKSALDSVASPRP